MRRHLLTVGVALAATLGTGVGLAEVDVKFSKKKDVEKAVAKLVGGEIDYTMSREREQTLNEIDGNLQKDTKGVALRTPAFWVGAMQHGYFEKRTACKRTGRGSEEKGQLASAASWRTPASRRCSW